MLQLDPANRPTFTDILKTEFVVEDKEYLTVWGEECARVERESKKGDDHIDEREEDIE